MQRGSSISTALALGFVTFVSLGARECSDMERVLMELSMRHEARITALADCGCPGTMEPVCGVDGTLWINACEARCALVSVDSVSPCARAECGGAEGKACEEGQFCETWPGCDAMAPGTCEEIPVPDTCPDVFAPVCGCDGLTYVNDCVRRTARVPLDFRGACEDPPSGCETHEDCGDREYCQRRPGVCDSGPGTCTERPDACTFEFDPVCGCDDETYSNVCAAAGAGVNVAFAGECEVASVACDGNRDCEAGEYCRRRTGRCDAEGFCEPRPAVCPLVIDFVCGCDGKTYDNACEAAGAGVSREDDEACRSEDGVAICHIPPGNPAARHTIYVGEPAVSVHLGHGDYLGPCSR